MKVLGLLLTFTCAALAGEYAVLASGARLHADRHEANGSKVVLYSNAGTIELDASAVQRFEAEDYVAPPPASAQVPAKAQPTAPDLKHIVDAAAKKHGLEPALVRSVVAAESAYRVDAVSPKGAVGLMQLMPSTAKQFGVDARDPAQNVDAGAQYLADLLRKYDGGLYHALAAYNAGPGAVQKYNGNVPPYAETVSYINRVVKNWKANSAANGAE